VNLDSLDEVRDHARINSIALKRRVELRHKTKTKPRQFKVANLVMRKAHPYQIENKLSPKWTGLFRVVNVLGNGAYKLETLEGRAIREREMQQTSSFISVKTFRSLFFSFEHYAFEVTFFSPKRSF